MLLKIRQRTLLFIMFLLALLLPIGWIAALPTAEASAISSLPVMMGPECKYRINSTINAPTNSFTNQGLVVIDGFAWNDLNANGIQDDDEPGVEGVICWLCLNGQILMTTTTNADGFYYFGFDTDQLDNYYLAFGSTNEAYEFTIPDVGDDDSIDSDVYTLDYPKYPLFGQTEPFLLMPGDEDDTRDVGIIETLYGTIEGMKFEDLNGNGQKDNGESGLENWTILLEDENSHLISTVTDQLGNYSFTDLQSGTYTVTESFEQGWLQTTPASGSHTVSLSAGQVVQELNFGNQAYADEYCHIGWDVHMNPNWSYVEVYMEIFNQSQATYDVELMGLPGLDELTTFTITPPSPVLVNGYQELQVTIDPQPNISNTSGPYQAIVTNLATNQSFACSALIWDANNSFWIDSPDGTIQSIPFGTAEELNFDFHNFSNEPITITYEIETMFTTVNEGGTQDQEIISLDGMEPGVNVSGELVIPAGNVVAIPVNVEFVQQFLRNPTGSSTEGAGDIILSVDVDQDGEIDAATSISVRSVASPTPTPTPTSTPSPTGDILYLPLIMSQSQ